MKVRYKHFNREVSYEVVERSESYYIVQDRPYSVGRLLFDKCDYEPVIEDRWQDVTEKCEQYGGRIFSPEGNGPLPKDNYRLRKVEVWQTSGCGGQPNCSMAAFIVECKVSD